MPNNDYRLRITVESRKRGDGIPKATEETNRFQRSLEALKGANRGVLGTFADLNQAGELLGAGLRAAGQAAEFVYSRIDEGSGLLLAEERFATLAGQVDSTADALLTKMDAATNNLFSDAQLISSASEIISLGLAKNEEDTIRLARVVGELGLDMQQVILTFANDSKARLDSLGLSIEDVEERTRAYEAAGRDASEAFDLAVLDALEGRLELLGSAAGTTAGNLQSLEATWENVQDAFARGTAEGAAGTLAASAESANNLDAGLQRVSQTVGQQLIPRFADAIDRFGTTRLLINQLGEETLKTAAAQQALAEAVDDRRITEYPTSIDRIARATANAADKQSLVIGAVSQAGDAYFDAGASLASYTDRVDAYNARLAERAAAEEAAAAAAEEAAERFAAAQRDQAQGLASSFDRSGSIFGDLEQARADFEAAQGDYVQVTRNTSGQISAINAQLAADLSSEQTAAFREILNTVDEGSAEWLAAYNALQGDLTESARAGLVAQRAALEGEQGTISSIYTGDAAAAEEAQGRITAANEAIAESYRQTALEGLLAQADSVEELGNNIAAAVDAGLISQEQAEARLEFAETTAAIEELNAALDAGDVSSAQYGEIFSAITTGVAETVPEAIERLTELDETFASLGEEAVAPTIDTAEAETAVSALQETMVGLVEAEYTTTLTADNEAALASLETLRTDMTSYDDTIYESLLEADGSGALSVLSGVQAAADALDGRVVTVNINVQQNGTVPDDFGGARAAGGPVSAGRSYLVGELGPELFTPGSSGFITDAATTAGRGAPVINIVQNFNGAAAPAAVGAASQQGILAAMRQLGFNA